MVLDEKSCLVYVSLSVELGLLSTSDRAQLTVTVFYSVLFGSPCSRDGARSFGDFGVLVSFSSSSPRPSLSLLRVLVHLMDQLTSSLAPPRNAPKSTVTVSPPDVAGSVTKRYVNPTSLPTQK
jgi:hypothetical protein